MVEENSILVVARVELGKVTITQEPMCFSQDNQALKPLQEINIKFMPYQIKVVAKILLL